MKQRANKIKNLLCGTLGAIALAVSGIFAVPVQAEEISPGLYSVTVTSTYQNPDTGAIDDVGQNPALGQTMVQAQVQTVGRVEITDNGEIYLDTRWNQADANIYAGFQTSSDLSQSWVERDFEVTNQLEAGSYEFSGSTFEATVTDYRIQLDTLSDTIRCTNYVEAMGREVVWFCYISEIYDYDESSWLNVEPPNIDTDTMNQAADTYEEQQSGGTEESNQDSQNTEASGEEDQNSSSTGTSSGVSSSTKKPSASSSSSSSSSSSKKTDASKEASAEESDTESKSEGKSVDGLKEKTVAEAKTAEELLNETAGLSDVDEPSKDTETVSASTGTVVLAVIGGLIVGGGIAGAIAFGISRKKRNYQDLFSDVDDRDDRPEDPDR